MVTTALMAAAILIALFFPHAPDLSRSTRAMLHPGFEGRTEIVAPPIQSTEQLLRGSAI